MSSLVKFLEKKAEKERKLKISNAKKEKLERKRKRKNNNSNNDSNDNDNDNSESNFKNDPIQVKEELKNTVTCWLAIDNQTLRKQRAESEQVFELFENIPDPRAGVGAKAFVPKANQLESDTRSQATIALEQSLNKSKRRKQRQAAEEEDDDDNDNDDDSVQLHKNKKTKKGIEKNSPKNSKKSPKTPKQFAAFEDSEDSENDARSMLLSKRKNKR